VSAAKTDGKISQRKNHESEETSRGRYSEYAGYENQRELQNCTGQDQGQKTEVRSARTKNRSEGRPATGAAHR
jgi:hypothetical protein